jgi:hypothetical protein
MYLMSDIDVSALSYNSTHPAVSTRSEIVLSSEREFSFCFTLSTFLTHVFSTGLRSAI